MPIGKYLVFCSCLVLLAQPGRSQTLSLNELMPANASTISDSDGDYPDWLELHNLSSEPADLTGYGLSDTADDLFRWTLPTTMLEAGGHLLVYASGKDTAGYGGTWHAVVTRGDTGRYLSGSAPPPTWKSPDFDDSNWPAGPSGFGYGDGDDATLIAPALSLFTRFTFDVADVAAIETAIFHMDFDDGFVAYLNGVEIARANLGLPGSETAWDQPADTFTEPLAVLGLPPQRFPITDVQSLIREGPNTLAVEVHNSSIGSSDLSCIPFLTLGMADAATTRPPAAEIQESFIAELHTNFRLSADGESLYLTDPTGVLVDSVVFGALRPDVSLGRQPDGVGQWHFFDEPSPAETNTSTGYLQIADPPTFSQPGGRFNETVTVALTAAPGLEIRYTTNGATPDDQSFAYSAPISVSRAAVLRARTLAPGYLPSEVITHTFIVGENAPLPIVSLSTDPPLLWDSATGIYAFPPDDQAACPNFPHFCANFWEDREIAAYIEIFDDDGDPTLRAGAGVTIVGGWSRAFPMKSLGLFARGRYGDSAFDSPLFADRPYDTFQSFLLRNSGNDWDSSMLRDGFLQTIVAEADVDRMAYRPAVLYLNGQYWGIHNMREKINEHYAAALGGVRSDEVDLLGFDEERPTSDPEILGGDTEHLEQLIAMVSAIDMSSPTSLESVATMMEIENFIDYQITQIFVGNTDWPGNNVKIWRPRTLDGRWRWILFDLDFGFGRWNPEDFRHNTLAFAAEPFGPIWPNPPWSTFLFRRLLENQAFRAAFVNRYADFLNSMFREDHVLSVLDSLQAAIADEMPDHLARWGQSYSGWLGHVNNLRYYARNRPAEAQQHLRSFFGLGSPVALTVSTTPGGRVRVNRLDVRESPWTGFYFPPLSVPITAVPEPGYRFVGWSGAVESDHETISVSPLRPLSLLASFERGTAREYRITINEIQYNPPGDLPSEDWVELHSAETDTIDLSGWRLSDSGGNDYTLPDGTVIPPQDFLVLARDTASFTAVYPNGIRMAGGWTFGLSNGGETVYLYDDLRLLVDSVAYSDLAPWPAAADGAGATLELVDPQEDNALASSWRASTVRGGTPGRPNSVAVNTDTGTPPPTRTTLGVPYPNPFRRTTTVSFGLPSAERVLIRVYDALGRHVATLVDATLPGGYHTATWDATRMPSGMYVIRMTSSDGRSQSVRGVLAR